MTTTAKETMKVMMKNKLKKKTGVFHLLDEVFLVARVTVLLERPSSLANQPVQRKKSLEVGVEASRNVAVEVL